MKGLSRGLVEKYSAVAMAPADIGRGFAAQFGSLANAHGANMAVDPGMDMARKAELPAYDQA